MEIGTSTGPWGQAPLDWPQLADGEHVAWRGKPVRSRYTTKDAKLTLSGIPVAVFMTFWMALALRIPKKGSPDDLFAWIFPLFGLLFVLQALYMLVGHYLKNWLEWQNVAYAVTNKRVVARRGLWQVSESSRLHSDIPMELKIRGDGTVGDIVFESPQHRKAADIGFFQRMEGGFFAKSPGQFGLFAIEQPQEVYRILISQASAARQSAKC